MIFLQPVSLRPRRWPALIPGAMALLLLAFIPFNSDTNVAQIMVAAMFGLSLLLWWVFSKAHVDIDGEGITQVAIFYKRHVSWTDLVQTYIRYERRGKSGGLFWLFVPAQGPTIKLSVGFYSRSDLRQLAEAAVSYSPFEVTDDRIRQIAEGRFPWYIF